ncbi:MAG: hypothetical protein DMG71_11725 [Acidobacteria bacterium]|nr:MAG: hypothetical protein DMG71_11725 [Acidobacteriota bacterium]
MIAMTIPLLTANSAVEAVDARWCWGENPELGLYRRRTVALLRRYLRLSIETGRVPSLLGREFFRTRVTSYHISTFEDVVIFVHDVERCLGQLDEFAQQIIARIVLQEYTQDESARLLGCSRRQLARTYPEALDHLTDIFLAAGILKPISQVAEKSCQEGETEENVVSV